jgi:hypothetical protein
MKAIESKNFIASFEVKDRFLFYLSKGCIYKDDSEIIKLGDNFFGTFYCTDKDIIVQYYAEPKFIFFDFDGNLLFTKIGYFNYGNLGSDLFYLDILIDKIRPIHAENSFLNTNEMGWLSNGDYYLINKRTEIQNFSISKNKLLWNFSTSTFGSFKDWGNAIKNYEILQFLGIWRNELLVACSNSLLLSIDIDSGELLYKWHELPGYALAFNDLKNKMPPGQHLALDVGQGKIFGVHMETYFEIDLGTREVHVESLKQELKVHDIAVFIPCLKNPFTNINLYLTANMIIPDHNNNWQDDAIVILNRNTRKIEWKYVFEKNSLAKNVPKLAGNKLYQLDINGTLHIFEEE